MGFSKGLSISALIIGITGLGLSGYTFFFALPEQTQQISLGIQKVWYVSRTSSIEVYNVEIVIPDLSIIASINPGESLHIFFSTMINIQCDGIIEILTVYVCLDGHKVGESNYGADHDHKIWAEITLQYSNLTISPGIYNISMITFSTDSVNPNYLYDMTLLAFTSK